jgi:hypothetical protein
MAEFRKVKCDIWRSDEWFQELPTDARLLWVYLFTNDSTSVAGIYKIPLRTVAFESGLSLERVKELLAEFAKADKAYYENGVLWVVNMRRHQAGETPGATVLTCIEKDLALIPYGDLKKRYLIHYGYTTDTLPGDRDRDRDRDKTETETETPVAGAPVPPAHPKRQPSTPKSKTPAEDTTHPAVVLYRDIVHLTPNSQQRKLIAEGVTDLGKWQAAIENWLAHSWNPRNVPGMLDVYHGSNGAKPITAPGKEHPAITAMHMVQAEREKERREKAEHGDAG